MIYISRYLTLST